MHFFPDIFIALLVLAAGLLLWPLRRRMYTDAKPRPCLFPLAVGIGISGLLAALYLQYLR